MSLNIRYLTNGTKEVFTVRNAGVTPISFEIFDKREDIDERMRHYVPQSPTHCTPNLARNFGVLDLLYPNHPVAENCVLEEFADKKCIWEDCNYLIYSEKFKQGKCSKKAE